jgi:hypothetical protein
MVDPTEDRIDDLADVFADGHPPLKPAAKVHDSTNQPFHNHLRFDLI